MPDSKPASSETVQSSNYLPQVDGLRGVAILMVVLHHYGFHLPGYLDWGPVGVRMFFLLSGYLITLSLWKMQNSVMASQSSLWIGLGDFHCRRLLRLVPALYFMLGIGWLIGWEEYRDGWFWHAAFLTNFHMVALNDWAGTVSHLWSLAVQEQFYLLWPLILLVPKKWFPGMLLLLVVCALTFRIGCIHGNTSTFWRWFMLPGCLDAFAIGAAIAWLMTHRAFWLKPIQKNYFWLGLCAFLCFALARRMRFFPYENEWSGFIELLENLFLGWILLGTILGWKGWLGKLLASRPMVHTGRISYGIYIFHMLVALIFGSWLDQLGFEVSEGWFVLHLVTLLTITYGIAWVCWVALDKPLAQWKTKPVQALVKMVVGRPVQQQP